MTTQTPDAVREAVALLPKLRDLLKPATARPWRVFDGGRGLLAIMKGDRPKIRSTSAQQRWKEIVKWAGFDGTDVGKRYDHANITLMVEAVNALPTLLDAIEHMAALDSRAGDAGEGSITGADIWESLFAIYKQDVPEQITDDVCVELAGRLQWATSGKIGIVAALQAQEEAEDARSTCECEGEGQWEHCGPCSLRFGRAIDLRRAALSATPAPAVDAVAKVRDEGPMREGRVSLMTRAIRQSLRDYGHKVAESSLPECIAADVEQSLLTMRTPPAVDALEEGA